MSQVFDVQEATKSCAKCKQVLPVSRFYKASGASGYRSYCKGCMAKPVVVKVQPAIAEGMKFCKKCSRTLPISQFHKASGAERLRSYCKECGLAGERARRALNPQEWDAKKNARRDPEEKKATVKAWHKKNPERSHALSRLSAQRYVEKLKEQGTTPYALNKDKPEFKERVKAGRKRHRARHLQEIRHKENVKYHRRKGAEGSFTLKEWRELCVKFGNRCLCCGATGKLTKDHVVPLIRGGTNYIGNIQPLCLTCNCSKKDKTIDYRPKEEGA